MLQVFLRQEGHVSADDLFDLVRREAAGIGRATVYRTLQWLVDAGVARKVDFGEGRSRFEPSYRHPRHFHLICTSCHSSSEFLSSDVESLLEEIAAARNFRTKQATVQIHGVCEQCSTIWLVDLKQHTMEPLMSITLRLFRNVDWQPAWIQANPADVGISTV